MRKAGNKSSADRIGNLREYDWYGAGEALDCSQGSTGRSKNHVWIQGRQFRSIGPQPAGITATPTVINFEITAFHPSVLQQTKFERCSSGLPFRIWFRREQNAEPPRVARLLRVHRVGPRGGCTAGKVDELTPPHSITSSAETISNTVRSTPSALTATPKLS